MFHTTPTPEVLTRFPLALVPGFLVPLAFMVHFVSLWQLRRDRWRSERHVSAPLDSTPRLPQHKRLTDEVGHPQRLGET